MNTTTQTETRRRTSSEILSAEMIATICREEGAEDVGFVEVDRPELACDREGIREVFPRTKTLISLIGLMNRESIRSSARHVANEEFHHTIHDLTDTARRILKRLNKLGIRGAVPTVGFPMDMNRIGDVKIWDVSHKLVAEEAGLGKRGLHRNVIHPKLGNYILLETLLIDAEVDHYDRPIDYNPCLKCNLCVSACPVGAIHTNGDFDFSACMTHNYREFFGGFQDWVETIADSNNSSDYRNKVQDDETANWWQSLSFGANYKAAYCMAVCPAGEDVYFEFGAHKKQYIQDVVRPLKDKVEPLYVQKGTPAEKAALKATNKEVRYVHNRLRPSSILGFLRGLPIAFNPLAAEGFDFSISFQFSGREQRKATVKIKNNKLKIINNKTGEADLHIKVDSQTWIGILNQQTSPIWAVLTGKLKLKGNPLLLLRFQKCVPV